MRKTSALWLAVFIATVTCDVLTGAATAGVLDQDFVDQLAQTPRTAHLSGLVMMREQLDVTAMGRDMATLGVTSRWRRHQYVVLKAQEIAERTQRDLLGTLETWKESGRVKSYDPYWIANVVFVEALPEVFEDLADRADIGTIYRNYEVELRTGWQGEAQTTCEDQAADGRIAVNVQPAWDQGYDGTGRLVADFDTGADGNHPALSSRWRGTLPGVNWWEAWKDPYNNTQFPYDTAQHGTHTLGIMVAKKPTGTPVGIAPGAHWIAALISLGWNVQKIYECYQWATDPDGDPNTVDDVPDVINNSWGTSGNCDQTYWAAIDIVEAAGIVNTVAVDNSGPGPETVNSPESRALTSNVNWGVGNVNPHQAGYPINSSSGRGPSPCDHVSIKPEVTAPGTSIYSTLPNNGYGCLTGTSMACPHTSGAAAILRQVNPDLTVDEVKTALMVTAFDRGAAGEDNDYGWGIIDIGAAVEFAKQTLPAPPPQSLTAELSGNDVSLIWQRPAGINPNNPLIKYRVYRAPVGEPFPLDPIAEIDISFGIPNYTDLNLPFGNYHYVVTAVYQYNESGPSNEVEVDILAPPSPPRNLMATVNADTVRLVWEIPDNVYANNPVLQYRVYRDALADTLPASPIADLPDSVLQFTDSGLATGGYEYTVTALFVNGESAPSNPADVAVLDPAAVVELDGGKGPFLVVSPNPLSARTLIRYSAMEGSGSVRVAVYDLAGARVAMLAEMRGDASSGEQSIEWDGSDAGGHSLASGAYFLRLETPGKTLSRRIILLK